MPCDFCHDVRYSYRHLTELAEGSEEYTLLLECPRCRSLYELVPESKSPAELLTPADARRRYPGAL